MKAIYMLKKSMLELQYRNYRMDFLSLFTLKIAIFNFTNEVS